MMKLEKVKKSTHLRQRKKSKEGSKELRHLKARPTVEKPQRHLKLLLPAKKKTLKQRSNLKKVLHPNLWQLRSSLLSALLSS
jgi:hypothetical protein